MSEPNFMANPSNRDKREQSSRPTIRRITVLEEQQDPVISENRCFFLCFSKHSDCAFFVDYYQLWIYTHREHLQ